MHARTLLTLVWLILTFAISAHAATPNPDWPRFRGPTAMGVAQDDPRLPDTWSKTENVRWVTDIAGLGWASPIVSGGRVFLTSVSAESEYEKPGKGLYKGMGRQKPPEGVHHWRVCCLDLESGKILWEQEAHQGEPKAARHPKSTYASETPVTDGARVYALFGDVGLYCYDFDGKLFCLSEDGDTYVIQPGREFKVVGTNRLEELCMACPAVVDGKLILRTASKVYCVGR